MDTKPTRRIGELRRSFRTLHSRTWELELLISGALVFLLTRLPPVVDRIYVTTDPWLAEGTGLAAFLVYYYVKLILLTLLGSFLVHLATRAFWVGMVGLDSVFPRGVDWGSYKGGPASRDVLRQHMPSVKRLIGGADAVSSVIFSVAWAGVTVFVGSILVVGLFSGLALAVDLVVPGNRFGRIFGIALFSALGLLAVSTLVDKHFGHRFDRDRPIARWNRRVIGTAFGVMLQPLHGPVLTTLQTRLRSGAVGVGAGAMMALVIGVFVLQLLGQRDVLRLGDARFRPEVAGAESVAVRHYESFRRGAVLPQVPTLPSDVVDGPYVRLFLPYVVDRDERDAALLCPDAPALGGRGPRLVRPRRPPPPAEDVDRVMACLSRLWVVELDGERLEPDLVFIEHPENGVPGLAAYLDVRALEPGRHLLVVERVDVPDPDAPDDDEGDADRPARRYHIPFWS